MRRIHRLLSVVLISSFGVNSGVAMSKVPEQVTRPVSSTPTQPMIIANPLNLIRDVLRTGNTINQTIQAERRRQEVQRREQELKAAQQREAERQQQYFNSLSPEQQQAYIAQQRARKERADQAMIGILGIGGLALLGSMGSGQGSNQQDRDRVVMCTGFDSQGNTKYYNQNVRAGERPDMNCD